MGGVEPPREFLWNVGSAAKSNAAILDLFSAQIENREAGLKIGQGKHRLLIQLCSDFYRPLRIASLHYSLYPGQFYNPTAAPARVQQSFSRLRSWFSEMKLPLLIEVEDGQARLVAEGPIGIRILDRPKEEDRLSLLMSRLQDTWSDASFSRKEAEHCLEAAPRTVSRVLSEGVREGLLMRLGKGKGPGTRYYFPKAG
jgi:hypothetical protein